MEYIEIIVSLVVLASAFFGGVAYILRLSINPIKDDIREIKTILTNHVTETNKKIDDLKNEQNKKIDDLKNEQNKKIDSLKDSQNKKIDSLKDSQTQSFEKIYKILLDKKIN